jgi:ABC-type polysaccharide/polyol phosphate export permease
VILDKAAVILKKDLLTAIRYRNASFISVMAPAAQLATFYYLSRAVGPQFRPEGMPYSVFLLIGTGFYSFLLTGMHGILRSVQQAQQSGTLEVLMTSSTRPAVLVSLSAVSAFASASIQFGIYVGAGILLFAHGIRGNLFAVTSVFLLSVLIGVAIGILAAGFQVAIHKGSAVLWAIGSSSWLMSGTLFPAEALPRPMRALSGLLPFTHSLTGMRLAVMQPRSSALSHELAILQLFAAVLSPVSIAFLSWTVRRARLLGTLSFY